jgi:hypothetical protein
MRAPIIVVTDDTLVFGTIEAAERYLEPWSVEEGTLRIYDRDGRPLVAQIAKTRILNNEVVTLSDSPGAAPEPDALMQAPTDFLTVRGVEVTEEVRSCRWIGIGTWPFSERPTEVRPA